MRDDTNRTTQSVSIVIILLAVALGLIPAFIARGKGRSFLGWWIFGALLLIVALPLALVQKDRRPRCPHCAEMVQTAATVCPHCQRTLGQDPERVMHGSAATE